MSTPLDLTTIDPELGELLELELEEVVRRVETQVASDFAPVNSLCLHVGRYHGKMLRPLLVLLSGLAVDPSMLRPKDAHRTVAGVVELIHLATLVHDDILDDLRPIKTENADSIAFLIKAARIVHPHFTFLAVKTSVNKCVTSSSLLVLALS